MTEAKIARKRVMDIIAAALKTNIGELNLRRYDDRELLIKIPQPDGGPIYIEVLLKLPI